MSVELPYISEARPDTGLTNAKIGIWLFLASEVMLFGGLFSAYVILRMNATHAQWDEWSSILSVPLATLNTIFLITSSITVVLGWASLMKGDFDRYRFHMVLTLLFGAGFVVVKYFEYSAKFSHHMFPGTNPFLAIYFTLTGLHGLHVLAGMVIMLFVAATAARNVELHRVENVGIYWHFVDIVWIFLFPLLYIAK